MGKTAIHIQPKLLEINVARSQIIQQRKRVLVMLLFFRYCQFPELVIQLLNGGVYGIQVHIEQRHQAFRKGNRLRKSDHLVKRLLAVKIVLLLMGDIGFECVSRQSNAPQTRLIYKLFINWS
jgi:hypothetical protein